MQVGAAPPPGLVLLSQGDARPRRCSSVIPMRTPLVVDGRQGFFFFCENLLVGGFRFGFVVVLGSEFPWQLIVAHRLECNELNESPWWASPPLYKRLNRRT